MCRSFKKISLASDNATVLGDEATEDEGGDSGKLDQNVDGRAGSVLKRVTNGVTDDGVSVLLVTLLDLLGHTSFDHVRSALKKLSLNELLAVVPGATSVGGRESNLDAADNVTGKETRDATVAEEKTHKDRGNDDDAAGGDHLSEGSVGGDGDALSVVSGGTSSDQRNLSADLSDHVLSGGADSLHGQSRESVGDHSAEQETSEGEGLEDVNHVGRGENVSNTGNVGTEKSESDEASRANGEALTNSGGSVTSGIEGISAVTDRLIKVAHLSNTTSIVRDRAIAVNSEANGEAAEHANSTKSNTVHSSPVESEQDSDGEADNGDNVGHVAKSETLDDVGSSTQEARSGELAGGAERVGGVVLSGETNKEAGPETEHDAAVHFPSLGGVSLVRELNAELIGENVNGGHEASAHQDGGDEELGAELPLDGHADVNELNTNE